MRSNSRSASLFNRKTALCLILPALFVLFGLYTRHSSAQAPASAAELVSVQPASPAGTEARFLGRNFKPGEAVTFKVGRIRRVPGADDDFKTPAATANVVGSFAATWKVCDCAGELLQVEATGKTSGRNARATLFVLPAPPADAASAGAAQSSKAAARAGVEGDSFTLSQTFALQAAAATDSPTHQQLKSFGKPSTGGFPQARLLRGADGALYGTTSGGGSFSLGTVFKINPDGTGFALLHEFDFTNGGIPTGELIQGADGALYGATQRGGSNGYGAAFKINPDGSGFAVLHHFDNSDGAYPYAALLRGADGALYGTTQSGGSSDSGVVFKMNIDGSGFAVILSFNGANGANPTAALIQGADGALYGTASGGGSGGFGAVFKLNPNGSGFAVLHQFDSAHGANPYAELLRGTDGALYGTTQFGGSDNKGVVFKMNTNGSGFAVLNNFGPFSTGANPTAGLIQGTDGALYGTAQDGEGSFGTAFKIYPNGGFAVLHTFNDFPTGAFPVGGLMQGAGGALYGTTQNGGSSNGGTIFKLATDGSGHTILKNFSGGPDVSESGGYPVCELTQGADGALYGTTQNGGSYNRGVVFKINPDGTGYAVLHHFDLTDGGAPNDGVIQGADGALYGLAPVGSGNGAGALFKLNTDGTGFTVLYDFEYSTGGIPTGRPLQGADGKLYGTTSGGGAYGFGGVFKINPDGTGFAVLHDFDSANGANPLSTLIRGTDGALYGTTLLGGVNNGGVAFKVNPDGSGFAVIRYFDESGGTYPYTGLLQGADGALYGTTQLGGSNDGGTVFKMNLDGSGFAVILNFDFQTGYNASGRLIQGADGALYGTAASGGVGYGTVFKVNPDGSGYAVPLNFDNANGANPLGAVMQGADGALYGTTQFGGEFGVGAVYRLVLEVTEPDADGDGYPDAEDNCPAAANPGQFDTDGDGQGDVCDDDDDNDGVPDATDAFPLDPDESVDTDHDGAGDNADPDDDNDGVSDTDETAAGSDPLNAASTPEVCDGIDNDLNDGADEGFANTDGDSQADCVDTDDDNDGVSDSAEIAAGSDPLNAHSTPEVCDGADNDLDGSIDEGFTNTDGDAQADCVDADDDNDGQTDADELACGSNPLDANSKATDTDGDHRPDCVDTDDDNDGVPDANDSCPSTPPGTTVNAYGCPLAVSIDQCNGTGWNLLRRADNTTFKNQSDCNKYVKKGK